MGLMLLTEEGVEIALDIEEPCILKLGVRRLGCQLRIMVEVEETLGLAETEEARAMECCEMVSLPFGRCER
jgi:hypothetical protein